MIRTTDYHTAGEPFRIVLDGVPDIPGATVKERREHAHAQDIDRIRRLLCHEPRGHADMYGCFLVPPDDAGADLGVLFWHKDGYSTACGHGTIALGAWAVETGRVEADPDGTTDVTIDVPSGRVIARVRCAGGAVQDVTFVNVPSFVVARGDVDVAYGGALYASVEARSLGLTVEPGRINELIAAGREVKRSLRNHDLYGTIIWEALGVGHQRNVTIFADGEVDRSPCGSGTSARLALLAEDGFEGVLRHESIVGTTFTGRVAARTDAGVITEVTGTAFRTGEHEFVLDPRDPLGTGFVLR